MGFTVEGSNGKLELAGNDFDEDAPTIVEMRSKGADSPPALPFTLRRKKSAFDASAWLESLPTPAQSILRRAAVPAPSWPIAPRVPGAVAMPAHKIPSLRPAAP